jgi:hypothetical protein
MLVAGGQLPMRVNIKGCDQVAPPRRGERISPGGTFESSPLRSGGKKALEIAPSRRDDRTLSPWLAYGLPSASSQSIVPCGTGRFCKNATHHFVVGYFQMSLRDEVLSECYLALCRRVWAHMPCSLPLNRGSILSRACSRSHGDCGSGLCEPIAEVFRSSGRLSFSGIRRRLS